MFHPISPEVDFIPNVHYSKCLKISSYTHFLKCNQRESAFHRLTLRARQFPLETLLDIMKEELLLGFGVRLKHSKISAFRIHGDTDGSVDVRQFFQADSFKHRSRI